MKTDTPTADKARRPIALSWDDRVFYGIINVLLTVFLLLVLYPLINIVSSSFSSGTAVSMGKVVLWPVDFSVAGYQAVFKSGDVIVGYRNTLLYTVVGTLLNVFLTMIAAYPLSRRNLPFKGGFTFLFAFTMMFSGGMVPGYMLVRDLKILDTVWAMIIPGALSAYNLVLARTFLQNTIPQELLEATQIDGCNDFGFFIRIVLPLSKSILAVLTLYYAVGHWNSYFQAFLYLYKRNLYPLQLFLREILVMNQIDIELINDPELAAARQGLADLLKYAMIMVSTVPILLVYPFVQKHFVKGVMIGSLKG